MKKYLILAAATLAAMCACTKNEAYDAPQQSINFNVASYMPQTKANASILSETTSFNTYAYYHVNGGVQDYFTANGETITPDNTTNPTQWAPSKTYYWPKTGYINFYSYYGTQAPVVTDGSLTYGTATAPLTIAATDNLVFADPAFNQNGNLETYQMDSVEEGVPTLFHHALAQIAFDIKAMKVDDKADTWKEGEPYTQWDITINSASLVANNKGYLALSTTLPAATAEATNPAWMDYDAVGWTATTGTETINMTALGTNVLTEEAQPLLAMRSVMPQDIVDANVFAMTFTIKTTRSWDANNPVSEQITVSKKISEFTDAISAWKMNKQITYHITIDPCDTEKILFDPAVVAWETIDGGTLNLPEPTPATTE